MVSTERTQINCQPHHKENIICDVDSVKHGIKIFSSHSFLLVCFKCDSTFLSIPTDLILEIKLWHIVDHENLLKYCICAVLPSSTNAFQPQNNCRAHPVGAGPQLLSSNFDSHLIPQPPAETCCCDRNCPWWFSASTPGLRFLSYIFHISGFPFIWLSKKKKKMQKLLPKVINHLKVRVFL